MRISSVVFLGVQLTSVLAMPTPPQANHIVIEQEGRGRGAQGAGAGAGAGAGRGAGRGAGAGAGAGAVVTVTVTEGAPAATPPAAVAPPAAAPPAEGGAGEEAKENELEIEGVFATASALQGGELKQDVVFTAGAGATGKFEYEFQGANADELTVVENTTPAPPPAGFVAIEPNSYKVSLAVSAGAGLTLSKIDYIFDKTNAALAAMDLTKAQVGKLCTETNAFVVSSTLGELEFEVEENEVTLNLNANVTAQGEWGIFLPIAAAGAGAGAGGEAGAGAGGNATGEAGGKGKEAKAEAGEKGMKGPGERSDVLV